MIVFGLAALPILFKSMITKEQLEKALECKTAEELVLYDSTDALTVSTEI